MDGLRKTPDYLYSRHASEQLARRIREYWKENGNPKVDVRVEASSNKDSFENKVFFNIRSNLSFSVPPQFRKKSLVV